ncbi:ABC-three component system protein [Amycolatopsis sp. NPDC023774]|uniref:ABC-three component system protein n=1 Tax=Amycolatopsis sp. NPDC023774 TaxID=3155015 RepID=UPI0033E21ACE
MTSGPRLTPRQHIYFYSPDDWEEFVREWAVGLKVAYHAVRRLGGPNDQGVDVAGFVTSQGFEGDWDCFQCKHYKDALVPSDIWPELVKVFHHVIRGEYALPRRYLLMAPQGCGMLLERLLRKPSDLKTKFIAQLAPDKPACSGLNAVEISKIAEFVSSVDFSFIESTSLDDLVKVHSQTPYHVARFGGPLPDRPDAVPPPAQIADSEAKYVQQLVEVYKEKYDQSITGLSEALHNGKAADHFRRQRELFYSAESLRLFARDSVPPKTFEALQDDVYEGVIEVAEGEHADGMTRLTNVLQKVSDITLTSNVLIDVSNMKDRKGICHQLANLDRLVWCHGEADEPTK